MIELNITEAGSVQFPMVRHAAEIGWDATPPTRTPCANAAAKPGCYSAMSLKAKFGAIQPLDDRRFHPRRRRTARSDPADD